MKKLDIICDIETLGTSLDATMIQIAAVACDISTRTFKGAFNDFINVEKSDIIVTGGTLKWWAKTNPELFAKILEKGKSSEKEVLCEFLHWLDRVKDVAKREFHEDVELCFWGNGILFDNAILRAHCEKYDFTYPIKFWNDRDIRTLLSLASIKSGKSEKQLRDSCVDKADTLHDAMNDCKLEMRLAFLCYDILFGKYVEPAKKEEPKQTPAKPAPKAQEKADTKIEIEVLPAKEKTEPVAEGKSKGKSGFFSK